MFGAQKNAFSFTAVPFIMIAYGENVIISLITFGKPNVERRLRDHRAVQGMASGNYQASSMNPPHSEQKSDLWKVLHDGGLDQFQRIKGLINPLDGVNVFVF